MPTRETFLEAVIANPDDDTPRLFFADWLEENGDPLRAEFIRLQFALAGMAEDDDRYEELSRREHQITCGNHDLWIGWLARLFRQMGWRPVVGPQFGRAWFRRGFLEQATLDLDAFLRNVNSLFRAGPLRELRLYDLSGEGLLQLACTPALERVTALTLASRLRGLGRVASVSGDELTILLASPHLGGLREFSLYFNHCGPAGATALARSNVRNLQKLTFHAENIGTAGAIALADWPGLATVTELAFRRDSPALETLCTSRHLGRLTHLDLEYTQLSSAATDAIARTERLSELQVLRIGHTSVWNGGIERLAQSPYLRSLRLLDLDTVRCGPAGAQALARSAILESVAVLNLQRNPIGAEGAIALASSPALTGVKSLDLSECEIGDEGLAALAASPFVRGLTSLNLTDNGLTASAMQALTRSEHLTGLRHLRLGDKKLDDWAACLLARWPGAAGLKQLLFEWSTVGDDGAIALATSPFSAGIRKLNLRSDNMTRKGCDALNRQASNVCGHR